MLSSSQAHVNWLELTETDNRECTFLRIIFREAKTWILSLKNFSQILDFLFKLKFFSYFMQPWCSPISVVFLITAVISITWSAWAHNILERCSLNFIIIPRSSFWLAISNPNICFQYLLIISPKAYWCSSRDVWSSLCSCCQSPSDLCCAYTNILSLHSVLEFLPNIASLLPLLLRAMVCS